MAKVKLMDNKVIYIKKKRSFQYFHKNMRQETITALENFVKHLEINYKFFNYLLAVVKRFRLRDLEIKFKWIRDEVNPRNPVNFRVEVSSSTGEFIKELRVNQLKNAQRKSNKKFFVKKRGR